MTNTGADVMTPRSAPKRLAKLDFLPRRRPRRRLPLILGAIVLVLGLYTVAAAVGGPWLVDRSLDRYRDADAGRTASRASIGFNPFTWAAEIEDLELRDAGAGASLTASRIVADYSLRSVLEGRPVVASARVEAPRIELASAPRATAPLGGLRESLLAEARLDRLEIAGGTFVTSSGNAGSIDIGSLVLTGFDGRAGSFAGLRFDATTADGAGISVDGSVASSFDRATGRLRVDAVPLGAVASLVGGIVASVEPAGRLDLTAAFDADGLLDMPVVALDGASVELTDLVIVPGGGLRARADRMTASGNLQFAVGESGFGGRLETDGAEITIHDARATPAQIFDIHDAAVVATIDDAGLLLLLGGELRQGGAATLTVSVPPGDAGRRLSIEADALPAISVAAYAPESVRDRITGGDIDVDLEFARRSGRAEGTLGITARDLAFAERPAEGEPADGPDLELAAALLEDADGGIELELPFATSTGSVGAAATDALMARLANVTETPFDTLAALLNGEAAPTGAVPFLPGNAALNDRGLASVTALAEALGARPRLGIRVHSGYDAAVDREALARQQIELHVQLATAAPDGRARPEPVDFGSPRAQDVLDEFAGERLPEARVADLAARFNCEGPLADVCRRTYYERIFAALVENEQIGMTTLGRLGRFRAQTIADALEERGVSSERIELVAGGSVTETAFGVGVPVELTTAD